MRTSIEWRTFITARIFDWRIACSFVKRAMLCVRTYLSVPSAAYFTRMPSCTCVHSCPDSFSPSAPTVLRGDPTRYLKPSERIFSSVSSVGTPRSMSQRLSSLPSLPYFFTSLSTNCICVPLSDVLPGMTS